MNRQSLRSATGHIRRMFWCRIVVDQFLPRLPACRFVSFRRTRPCPVGPRISLVLASALTCISSRYLGSWRFFNVPHSLPRTSLSLSLSPNESSTMIRRLCVALCILCHLAFFIAISAQRQAHTTVLGHQVPVLSLVHCPSSYPWWTLHREMSRRPALEPTTSSAPPRPTTNRFTPVSPITVRQVT